MKPIGIVSALAAEARTLGPAVAHGAGLRRLPEGALLAVSGIGAAAAAAAARRLVLAGAGGLVSFGMAGGLDPTLACGTVLLPEFVAAIDGSDAATSPAWRERLRVVLAPAYVTRGGTLLASDRPLGRAAKADAYGSSRACAVDMESAAVAQVAGQAGLPFIVLRVIVDTAGDELPAAVIAASPGGRLRTSRLILGLLRAPGQVAPLVRLAKRYRIAGRALSAVAAADSPARRALVGGPDVAPS